MSNSAPDVDAIESDVGNVTEARCKLEDLLNDIVDKNENGIFHDDDEDDDLEEKRGQGTIHPYTPTKKSLPGRGHRKRKKKDSFHDDLELSNKPSYVIKMFDRRVNLAKFNESTSLYVMLRDWMRNKPTVTDHDTEGEDNTDDENSKESGGRNEDFIYELPKPVKLETSQPNLDSPASKTTSLEDIMESKEVLETLKKDNMFRWKEVRNKWKENSMNNQHRHMQAIMILNSMASNHASNT